MARPVAPAVGRYPDLRRPSRLGVSSTAASSSRTEESSKKSQRTVDKSPTRPAIRTSPYGRREGAARRGRAFRVPETPGIETFRSFFSRLRARRDAKLPFESRRGLDSRLPMRLVVRRAGRRAADAVAVGEARAEDPTVRRSRDRNRRRRRPAGATPATIAVKHRNIAIETRTCLWIALRCSIAGTRARGRSSFRRVSLQIKRQLRCRLSLSRFLFLKFESSNYFVIMADVQASPAAASPAAAASAGKKSGGQKKTKAPRAKPSHPRTSEMVNNAIKSLKERGGSSLQAIKKYVSANYKVDAEKLSPFIKKYLKSAVAGGALVQTKGKGASGSFKLAASASSKGSGSSEGGAPAAKAKSTKRTAKPKTAAKKPAASKAKKPAGDKKTAVKAKKPSAEKKAAAPAPKSPKAKSPSKAKKSNKGPTKKPKAPKPKKAKAASAPKSPKKAASPKKK